MAVEALPIDIQILIKGAMVLRALNNPTRQSILRTIHRSQWIKVTDIYKKLKMVQSDASQHLAILRRERFVKTERNGKEIYYSINYERFEQMDKLIKNIIK